MASFKPKSFTESEKISVVIIWNIVTFFAEDWMVSTSYYTVPSAIWQIFYKFLKFREIKVKYEKQVRVFANIAWG